MESLERKMKSKFYLTCWISVIVGTSFMTNYYCEWIGAAEASPEPGKPPTTESPTATEPTAPANLPGNGMAQHPFLYCGEFDTRDNRDQAIFLVKDGKVVWTYKIPIKDAHGQLSEFDDIHMLSNGNVLFACKTGAGEVTADTPAKVVWSFECPMGTECHSAQPIGLDKVLLCLNGLPPKCMLINIKSGQTEMEHELPCKNPTDPKGVHGQFRHIRMTPAGTYLIAALGLGKVLEFDKDWNQIWECPAPSVWAAVRLKNGNTLLSGNQNGWVREVNPKGETVWEVNKDELPGFPILSAQEADRLANGNTVICNWNRGGSKSKPNVQLLEVTPEKKVVWALYQWKDPDLGPSSCVQLLDELGREENGDLRR